MKHFNLPRHLKKLSETVQFQPFQVHNNDLGNKKKIHTSTNFLTILILILKVYGINSLPKFIIE